MWTGTRRAGGGVARFLSTPSPGRARIGTLRRAAMPGRWQDDGVRRNRGRYRIRMDAAARKPATGPHGGRCPLPGPPPGRQPWETKTPRSFPGFRGGFSDALACVTGRKKALGDPARPESPGVHVPAGISQGDGEQKSGKSTFSQSGHDDMQKAPGIMPEAFITSRGNRWLMGTFRKASNLRSRAT